MPHRPLVFVAGLTFGDYLLWNWSLNSNHDVLALVSGLTMPPLAVVCVWLLALSVARVIGRVTRQRTVRGSAVSAGSGRRGSDSAAADGPLEHRTGAGEGAAQGATAASAGAPSGKLAA